MTLTLAQFVADGSTFYLRDDPDGSPPHQTADPFDARPFPDRAAVDAYLAAHPGVDRPGVQVVPWPIDLDRAVCPGPPTAPGKVPSALPGPATRRAKTATRRTMELFA